MAVPIISPPGGGSGGTSAPIEEPVFTVIREGTALRPSIRIVGRVNGSPINVPATEKAKALAALDRLLDSFFSGNGKLAKSVDEESQPIGLVDIWTSQQVLLEHVAAIEEALVVKTPEPPKPTDDDAEFWAQFLGAPDPDPETFEPEVFESYSRGRVLYQWRAEYAPTGKRIYPQVPVAKRMALIRDMAAAPDSHDISVWCRAHGVDFETFVYAVLAGYCDGLLLDSGFGWRIDELTSLPGKTAADLFARDIAGAVDGGTPGIGG
jgi:hypothetical protein